jgi:hypothetical protein
VRRDSVPTAVHSVLHRGCSRARCSGRCLGSGWADGPPTPNFFPVPFEGNTSFEELSKADLSEAMTNAVPEALIRDRRDGSRDQEQLISTSALPGRPPELRPL